VCGCGDDGGSIDDKAMFVKYFIIWCLCALLGGCHSVKYVPVETVRKDSVYINKFIVDSIYRCDSVYLETKGDTVFKTAYRYKYRYKMLRDTVIRSRTDTVSIPYPVEKELSRWEKIKLDIGGVAIGVILCLSIALIIVIWIRRSNGV